MSKYFLFSLYTIIFSHYHDDNFSCSPRFSNSPWVPPHPSRSSLLPCPNQCHRSIMPSGPHTRPSRLTPLTQSAYPAAPAEERWPSSSTPMRWPPGITILTRMPTSVFMRYEHLRAVDACILHRCWDIWCTVGYKYSW